MKDYRNITEEDGHIIVKTARLIVTEYLKNRNKLKLNKKFEDDYSFKSGIFVTLNNPNGLRGCIGYPMPDKQLFNALEDSAIAAATEDPRFSPVEIDELDSIRFEVTILTPPTKILEKIPQKIMSQIKVGRDGLIVKNGIFSGLLLPQVSTEYGWNEEEFLEHTCEKAGLPKDYWEKPETEIQKFEGIIFREEEPNGNIIQEK